MAHHPITRAQLQLNAFSHADVAEEVAEVQSERIKGIKVTLNVGPVVGGAKMGCRFETFTNCC